MTIDCLGCGQGMEGELAGKLSEQHREFCRLVVSGVSQAKAYAQVFDCTPVSAKASATKLMKKAYVQEEVSRLRAKARDRERKRDDKAIGNRECRMEMLWRMACNSEKAGNVPDAVRCVAELNRMDGAYEPEKIELSSDEVFRREVLRVTGAEPLVRSQG